MPSSGPSLALLQRAIDHISPDQIKQPTPCEDFDVRALVNHILYDLRQFEGMLTGANPGQPDADLLGNQDWSSAYRAATASLMATWRQRGVDGTITNRLGEFPATWGRRPAPDQPDGPRLGRGPRHRTVNRPRP